MLARYAYNSFIFIWASFAAQKTHVQPNYSILSPNVKKEIPKKNPKKCFKNETIWEAFFSDRLYSKHSQHVWLLQIHDQRWPNAVKCSCKANKNLFLFAQTQPTHKFSKPLALFLFPFFLKIFFLISGNMCSKLQNKYLKKLS